ncbi:MAG: hypothetical protein ACRCUP_04945 [Mycoplasmatales bacterium]
MSGNTIDLTTKKKTMWVYSYNEINQLTKVDDGHDLITTYAYDKLGNKTQVVYPNGQVVNYKYTANNVLPSEVLLAKEFIIIKISNKSYSVFFNQRTEYFYVV